MRFPELTLEPLEQRYQRLDATTYRYESDAIVAGEQPGSLFYADDVVIGLLDINLVTEGHALIIPRWHAPDLAALDEGTGQRLWTVAQRTAAALRASGLRCEGVNLFLADGAAAFQEVFHVHLHVFPRYA